MTLFNCVAMMCYPFLQVIMRAKMELFKPPNKWKELLACVKEIRASLRAPVDDIGCHRLHDTKAPIEDQRFQILVALMLSAQTRDQCTAEAMGNLKRHGLTVGKISRTTEAKVCELIKPVCFHNNKAKYIKKTTDVIVADHHGKVPEKYDELVAMPGLGPKMVHLYLQAALGRVEGIGVDVHVHRIAQRFKWVPSTVRGPEDTRIALEGWLPRVHWMEINELLVGLGQTVCLPRFPKCGSCSAQKLCPNAFKEATHQDSARTPPSAESSGNTKRGRESGPKDLEDLCSTLRHEPSNRRRK